MPSERIQRRIDSLLDEADEATNRNDWVVVRERAAAALAFDPDNGDAKAYQDAAERRLSESRSTDAEASTSQGSTEDNQSLPTSFGSGRYVVRSFLGEGGRKRVYLAHDETPRP